MGEEATKFEQPEEDRERQRDPPDDDPRHEPEEVGLHLNNGEAIFIQDQFRNYERSSR